MSKSRFTHPWVITKLGIRCVENSEPTGKQEGQASPATGSTTKTCSQQPREKAHKTDMNDTVSKGLKGNPRQFWSAIKSSRQEANRVPPLINKDGFLQSKKAEILNDQFHSNFTKEDISHTPKKFHMESPWDGGMKVCLNGPGHMTKMATTPETLKNLLQNQTVDDLETWYAASGARVLPSLFK